MAARRAIKFGTAADASNVGSDSLEQLRAETGRLAVARVRAGDLDGGREAVQPVLNLPVAQRIYGVVSSVVNVHRAITATASDAPAGREIQEAIESYCRTPAAALSR